MHFITYKLYFYLKKGMGQNSKMKAFALIQHYWKLPTLSLEGIPPGGGGDVEPNIKA